MIPVGTTADRTGPDPGGAAGPDRTNRLRRPRGLPRFLPPAPPYLRPQRGLRGRIRAAGPAPPRAAITSAGPGRSQRGPAPGERLRAAGPGPPHRPLPAGRALIGCSWSGPGPAEEEEEAAPRGLRTSLGKAGEGSGGGDGPPPGPPGHGPGSAGSPEGAPGRPPVRDGPAAALRKHGESFGHGAGKRGEMSEGDRGAALAPPARRSSQSGPSSHHPRDPRGQWRPATQPRLPPRRARKRRRPQRREGPGPERPRSGPGAAPVLCPLSRAVPCRPLRCPPLSPRCLTAVPTPSPPPAPPLGRPAPRMLCRCRRDSMCEERIIGTGSRGGHGSPGKAPQQAGERRRRRGESGAEPGARGGSAGVYWLRYRSDGTAGILGERRPGCGRAAGEVAAFPGRAGSPESAKSRWPRLRPRPPLSPEPAAPGPLRDPGARPPGSPSSAARPAPRGAAGFCLGKLLRAFRRAASSSSSSSSFSSSSSSSSAAAPSAPCPLPRAPHREHGGDTDGHGRTRGPPEPPRSLRGHPPPTPPVTPRSPRPSPVSPGLNPRCAEPRSPRCPRGRCPPVPPVPEPRGGRGRAVRPGRAGPGPCHNKSPRPPFLRPGHREWHRHRDRHPRRDALPGLGMGTGMGIGTGIGIGTGMGIGTGIGTGMRCPRGISAMPGGRGTIPAPHSTRGQRELQNCSRELQPGSAPGPGWDPAGMRGRDPHPGFSRASPHFSREWPRTRIPAGNASPGIRTGIHIPAFPKCFLAGFPGFSQPAAGFSVDLSGIRCLARVGIPELSQIPGMLQSQLWAPGPLRAAGNRSWERHRK
ncbi:uncharacterized protein LOC141725325 [Zonotrichia albicollis]|uniref:uncharacterized protein LOC141725325 n=1 Tax=Zonotrichia albicollis TaxID=44394 RepID=UPI003D80C42C